MMSWPGKKTFIELLQHYAAGDNLAAELWNEIENAGPHTNYFPDADLSILAQPWEVYTDYYQNVRKEYSIYPALIYNPGRKKVLRHFLAMDRIFKTGYFFNKFNQPARQNLQKEIDPL